MTTFYSDRVNAGGTSGGKARSALGWVGRKVTDVATITISAHPVTGDVYQMLRLPKGAYVTGGKLIGGSLVTAGTSTGYDIDVGWASNTSALGNFGVLSPAVITGFKPELGYLYPLGGLLFSAGVVPMTGDQTVILTVNTSAASANFATATLALEVEYVMLGAP